MLLPSSPDMVRFSELENNKDFEFQKCDIQIFAHSPDVQNMLSIVHHLQKLHRREGSARSNRFSPFHANCNLQYCNNQEELHKTISA